MLGSGEKQPWANSNNETPNDTCTKEELTSYNN